MNCVHTCYQVLDLDRSFDFLTNQLGLNLRRKAPPVEEILAMVEWALKHEGEAGFDPEKILRAWAEKRRRGY